MNFIATDKNELVVYGEGDTQDEALKDALANFGTLDGVYIVAASCFDSMTESMANHDTN